MKRQHLGELEELVMLLVVSLQSDAYGVSVRRELLGRTGRGVTLSTVHAVLHRLEEKGFLKSSLGEASPVRGGKRKRVFKVTAFGLRVLSDIREVRRPLWDLVATIASQRR